MLRGGLDLQDGESVFAIDDVLKVYHLAANWGILNAAGWHQDASGGLTYFTVQTGVKLWIKRMDEHGWEGCPPQGRFFGVSWTMS